MRLKLIADANFQYSEAENLKDVLKKNPSVTMTPADVVLLVSRSKDQMVFMHRPTELNLETLPGAGARKGTAIAYHSERVRLSRSTWNPLMLQNYANSVGIELDGLRRFEEIHEQTQQIKQAPRPSRRSKPGKVVSISAHRKAA